MSSIISRRSFLKLSGLTAIAACMSGCSTSTRQGISGGLLNGIIQPGINEGCFTPTGIASAKGKRMEIDGVEVTLPVDWNYAHTNQSDFKGNNWNGDDSVRGIGIFNCNEEGFDTQEGGEYSQSYSVNCRWDYCSYGSVDGAYPTHASYKGKDSTGTIEVGGTSASCVSGDRIINYSLTSDKQYAAMNKAKIIVYNPESGKACVCAVGYNGCPGHEGNPNWGGAPLALLGGITTATSAAIEAVQNESVLELFFTDTEAELGPIENFNPAAVGGVVKKKNKCKDTISADNSQACNLAVSLSYCENKPKFPGHEVIHIVSGSDTTSVCPTTQAATDQRKKVIGDPYTADCGYFVATVVRSTLDQEYPTGGTENQSKYCRESDKWQTIFDEKTDGLKITDIVLHHYEELQPGDVFITNTDGAHHTFMFVGKDAVKEQYGDLDDQYDSVSASQDEHGPRLETIRTSRTAYSVFRYIKDPDPDPKALE